MIEDIEYNNLVSEIIKPLLSIELVPQTCWYSNVRSEVPKSTWDIIKKDSSLKAKNRCEICNGKGPKWPVECHEVWNYDSKSQTQKLVRMISLCPSCHEVKHMGFANINGRLEQAKQHLAKINNWSSDQTDKYVALAFRLWEIRSNYEWSLDLSYLKETYNIEI